ncbi:MAG: GPW/gp25 family protein [Actinomycetota bacterium]
MTDPTPFVGSGVAFPMRLDRTGGVALVDGHDEIVESIRLILATAPGERPMRPEFGCAIHEYVFAPADHITAARLEAEVTDALQRWEPRIELIEVAVDRDTEEHNLLLIDIRYQLRDTNDPRNLVFPFYVIPHED